MNEEKDDIQYISKVEIKGLWERYDLEWKLNPDVNILSGINGSGKSTILNAMTGFMPTKNDKHPSEIEKIIVDFDDKINLKFYNHHKIGAIISGADEKKMIASIHNTIVISIPTVEFFNKLNLKIISTFDNELREKNITLGRKVRTELDRLISILQKQYLDYQLNISKKAYQAVKTRNESELLKIHEKQERFIEIIDSLFKETDKKIDRDKNEVWFLSGDKEISPYQLSSGEKQILVILLTVLVQDNKPSILFMDEPEISLHIDWQRKLIEYIRELNPNVQIILATHSPGLIIEGWADRVFDVRDLITKDYLKN